MENQDRVIHVFSVPGDGARLNWCEEQENTVTEARAQAVFGVGTASPVDDLKDKSAQIYSVLQNLLEGEPFMILRNTEKANGLEAWRRINRR